jgi:hypothetical protein
MIRVNESARALLAAASVFLIGAVAGVTLDRLILIPHNVHAASASAPGAMGRSHDQVLAELDEELGLTPEQAASVRAIFAKHQAGIDRAWSQVHEDLLRTIGAATTEVEGVLNDEQIGRLHAWLTEHHGPVPGHARGH